MSWRLDERQSDCIHETLCSCAVMLVQRGVLPGEAPQILKEVRSALIEETRALRAVLDGSR